MTIDEIRNIVAEWPKEKRLKYAGLCGQYSQGTNIEAAIKKAFGELNGSDDNDKWDIKDKR